MTKLSKKVMAISLAAVFAISVTVGQTAYANGEIPGFMTIDKSTVTVDGDILKAKITTEEKIPKNGNVGAFGYGLLTDGINNVLALTSHLCASDSEVQPNAPDRICPDPVGISILIDDFSEHDGANFHAHVLDLKPAETDCTTTYVDEAPDLEVDFESTVNTGNNVLLTGLSKQLESIF